MDALKRKEIIEMWEKIPEDLEKYCCPDCYTLLWNFGTWHGCINAKCENEDTFSKDGERLDD